MSQGEPSEFVQQRVSDSAVSDHLQELNSMWDDMMNEQQVKQSNIRDQEIEIALLRKTSLQLETAFMKQMKEYHDETIHLREQISIQNGRRLVRLVHTVEHETPVYSVRYSDDGRYITFGGTKRAMVFDVQTGQTLHPFLHDSDQECMIMVCMSPDNCVLAAADANFNIRVWNVATGQVQSILSGHRDTIWSLRFIDPVTIVSGSSDMTVRLWDINKGAELRCISFDGGVTAVAISSDRRRIAVACEDNKIRILDPRLRVVQTLGCDVSTHCVAFSPDGQELSTGGRDGMIAVWNMKCTKELWKTPVRSFRGHQDIVLDVCYTCDGASLLTVSKDKTWKIWNASLGDAGASSGASVESIISVSPSPKSSCFATGGGDMKLQVWESILHWPEGRQIGGPSI